MRTLRLGDKGSQVEELQSILQLVGYYDGAIDGNYGPQTKSAVAAFQKDFGLTADGIAGPMTYEALKPFLLGYDTYTIKPGDTFYKIAQRYYTSLPKILTANPNLNPFLLPIGAEIIVPYGIDVVQTNTSYTYDIMERDINGLKARYPFLQIDSIGNSVEGREVYRIRLGNGLNKVSYNASHHANEWITSPVLMKWVEEFAKAYSVKGSIRGYNTEDIWNQATIDIIPMVNPDGVNLVIDGISSDNPRYEEVIRLNRGSQDFSSWKANIRGVDLNRNYNAAWEEYI